MQIIEMKRRTLDGKRLPRSWEGYQTMDLWGVIETEEENAVHYDFCVNASKDHEWNKMVNKAGKQFKLKCGDGCIYGYIKPNEVAPEVGEFYTDPTGDIWVRTN